MRYMDDFQEFRIEKSVHFNVIHLCKTTEMLIFIL